MRGSQPRNPDGTFKQTIKLWSLEKFDEGYVDNKGRFRVRLPDHPRAYLGGYILRSRVAYEAYHGVMVPPNMKIHHKDGNQLNDSEENLEMMTKSEHKIHHCRVSGAYVNRVCKNCGKDFEIQKYRLKDTSSGKRGSFCTLKCFFEHNTGENHVLYRRKVTKCKWCGTDFEQIPSKNKECCSRSCGTHYFWKRRKAKE